MQLKVLWTQPVCSGVSDGNLLDWNEVVWVWIRLNRGSVLEWVTAGRRLVGACWERRSRILHGNTVWRRSKKSRSRMWEDGRTTTLKISSTEGCTPVWTSRYWQQPTLGVMFGSLVPGIIILWTLVWLHPIPLAWPYTVFWRMGHYLYQQLMMARYYFRLHY